MLSKLRSLLLAARKSLLLITATAVMTASLMSGAVPAALRWLGGGSGTVPQVDPRFVSIGRSYVPELGKAYSAAWDEGVKALESGESIGAALKVVGQSWEQGRTRLFDRLVTPELSKVVPDGKAEAEVNDADRKAVAGTWRGLAKGLKSSGRLGWPFGR
jgi:hypothetical protein